MPRSGIEGQTTTSKKTFTRRRNGKRVLQRFTPLAVASPY